MLVRIILLLLGCSPLFLNAQIVNGKIIDDDTQKGLAYVNIGVLNRTTGTVTDIAGNFNLNLDMVSKGDTIRISFIGYESKDIIVTDFIALLKKTSSVTLISKKYDLTEVVVIPRDYIYKIVGNTSNNKNIQAGFANNNLGHEVGVWMKIKKRPTYIESVSFSIAQCTYDSIFYRLNIYKIEKRRPSENILKEPIYLSFAKEDLTERMEVDLTPYNIYVEDDFMVSLEIVKNLGEGELNFSAVIFKAKAFFRFTSQSKWEKAPGISIGVSAKIRQEK